MLNLIKKPETNIIVGKSLEIGEKVLYPVIRISILKSNEGNIGGIWIIPIAIVIKEDSEWLIIRLTDENIDFDEILER